jgi:hypothetical protein
VEKMNNETIDGDVKSERESCGEHKREVNFLGSKVYFERIDEGLEEEVWKREGKIGGCNG